MRPVDLVLFIISGKVQLNVKQITHTGSDKTIFKSDTVFFNSVFGAKYSSNKQILILVELCIDSRGLNPSNTEQFK